MLIVAFKMIGLWSRIIQTIATITTKKSVKFTSLNSRSLLFIFHLQSSGGFTICLEVKVNLIRLPESCRLLEISIHLYFLMVYRSIVTCRYAQVGSAHAHHLHGKLYHFHKICKSERIFCYNSSYIVHHYPHNAREPTSKFVWRNKYSPPLNYI